MGASGWAYGGGLITLLGTVLAGVSLLPSYARAQRELEALGLILIGLGATVAFVPTSVDFATNGGWVRHTLALVFLVVFVGLIGGLLFKRQFALTLLLRMNRGPDGGVEEHQEDNNHGEDPEAEEKPVEKKV